MNDRMTRLERIRAKDLYYFGEDVPNAGPAMKPSTLRRLSIHGFLGARSRIDAWASRALEEAAVYAEEQHDGHDEIRRIVAGATQGSVKEWAARG
jgi:hypothetical protein